MCECSRKKSWFRTECYSLWEQIIFFFNKHIKRRLYELDPFLFILMWYAAVSNNWNIIRMGCLAQQKLKEIFTIPCMFVSLVVDFGNTFFFPHFALIFPLLCLHLLWIRFLLNVWLALSCMVSFCYCIRVLLTANKQHSQYKLPWSIYV